MPVKQGRWTCGAGMMYNKKVERNIDLYDDHCAGMTNTELVKKYGITRERVRQVIAQQDRVHGEMMGIDVGFGVEEVQITAWRKQRENKARQIRKEIIRSRENGDVEICRISLSSHTHHFCRDLEIKYVSDLSNLDKEQLLCFYNSEPCVEELESVFGRYIWKS